jgi:hypothetical protein
MALEKVSNLAWTTVLAKVPEKAFDSVLRMDSRTVQRTA